MSKTLVCINILDTVKADIYGSHVQEWFRLGRSTNDEFILFYPNRYSIDNARNQAASHALRNECDYLYFIDDDIILTPKTYLSLKENITKNEDVGIVQALTFIRGYPFNPMMFKYKALVNASGQRDLDFYHNYIEDVDINGCVEADAVGFSCVLIDIERTLKRINPPYFVTSAQSTEDIYFCLKLKIMLNTTIRFLVDTKVPTGHILHPEALSIHNREELLNYYEIQGYKKDDPSKADRGEEYKKRCLSQFNQDLIIQ